MKVTFNTDAYERTHGKAPKGEGSWGFGINSAVDGVETLWSPPMSLTAAKAWAKAQMEQRPVAQVPGARAKLHVMP